MRYGDVYSDRSEPNRYLVFIGYTTNDYELAVDREDFWVNVTAVSSIDYCMIAVRANTYDGVLKKIECNDIDFELYLDKDRNSLEYMHKNIKEKINKLFIKRDLLGEENVINTLKIVKTKEEYDNYIVNYKRVLKSEYQRFLSLKSGDIIEDSVTNKSYQYLGIKYYRNHFFISSKIYVIDGRRIKQVDINSFRGNRYKKKGSINVDYTNLDNYTDGTLYYSYKELKAKLDSIKL